MIEAIALNDAPVRFVPPTLHAAPDGASREVLPLPPRSEPFPLSTPELDAVVGRNSMARVTHALDDGRRRTRRTPYADVGEALFVPLTACPAFQDERTPRQLECDVSELSGLTNWRYVWIRGSGTLLQPTGNAADRVQWQQGVELLKRVMFELGPIQELAFANFCIVRIAIESKFGVRLPLE